MSDSTTLGAEAFELLADPPTVVAPEASPAGSAIERRTGLGQTESLACPGIFLRVHTDIEALEAEWRAFEAEAGCTAFQCYEWAAKWQRHIGVRNGTRPAIVLGRDAQGKLLVIVPLAMERRWFARRLTWLGS